MLVHQAAHAFTLMTGQPAPLAVMRAAFEAATPGHAPNATSAASDPRAEKTNAPR
jgi:hypothetical protein